MKPLFAPLFVAGVLLAACSGASPTSPATSPGTDYRAYVTTGDAVQLLRAGSTRAAKLPPGTLSPDGSLLFQTYGADVRAFDAVTGSLVEELKLADDYQQVAGFSPSGRYVALAGGSGDMSWFAVVPNGLRGPARTAMLMGSFSFDALSEDGSRLYLVEHLAGPDDYRV